LRERLFEAYPDRKRKTVLNWESQLWPFISSDADADRIRIGDTVGLPLHRKPTIAIGKIEGDYEYRPDQPVNARHTHKVKWLGEIARSDLLPDLRYSFGGAMTIFRINKSGAEDTVLKLATGRKPKLSTSADDDEVATDNDVSIDIAETARDEIRTYITQRFKGHGLTRLVAAVLRTQGYTVSIAPEGADKGVDIVAGKGPLGFETPRLAVQVKSTDSPADAATVQQLRGAMAATKADHGLFVSWAGYRGSLNWQGTINQHFDIRLWTDADLIEALQSCYDQLPADVQAELPLQRVWALVPSDE
jgi:restriction system protein